MFSAAAVRGLISRQSAPTAQETLRSYQASNDRWNQALAANPPNKELISHVNWWFKEVHGGQFPAWVTSKVIDKLIESAQFGDVAGVEAPTRSTTYNELSAEELISLLRILNSHLKDGNHNLTPQNGAVALALVNHLKKYITETLPAQNREKAMEVHRLLNLSSEEFLNALTPTLRVAILGSRQNGVSLEIAWDSALHSSPAHVNRELVSHIDYWFRAINDGVWPQWINENVRWRLIESSKIGTAAEAQRIEQHAIFSLLSAEELLSLYRLFQSHLVHGDHSLTPQNGTVAIALFENLQNFILHTLPNQDQNKAETLCKLVLRAPASHNVGALENPLMESLHLFKGPFGTVFNRDFFRALNVHQATTFTPESFAQRYWPVPTARLRESYEAFLNRVSSKKAELESADQSPSTLTPLIPKKIHIIWLGTEPPEDVLRVKKSWEDEHPGWEIKLWTNTAAEALIAEMRQQFPKVGTTWDRAVRVNASGVTRPVFAERADVLRICFLYKEGGIYVDSDLPNFAKVDDFHYFSDFFISLEQNDHQTCLNTSNALIGSKPAHPLLKKALNELQEREPGEDEYKIIGRTGPGLFTDQLYYGLIDGARQMEMPPLVLPPSYFFPLPVAKREVLAEDPSAVNNYVTPWTGGVHLWNFSWRTSASH